MTIYTNFGTKYDKNRHSNKLNINKMKTHILCISLFTLLIISCSQKKGEEVVKRYYEETYVGDNKDSLKLSFLNDENKVAINFYGEQIELEQIPSASGIQYKNKDYEFTQWQGETTLKKGEKLLFTQTPKTLEGELSMGHEANIFQPCGGDKEYWIYDKTGNLDKLYNKVVEGEKPYTVTFARIKVIDRGISEDGFSEEYDGVYEVVKVEEIRKFLETDCK